MTKLPLKARRYLVLRSGTNKRHFKKGDRRPKETRYCTICGRPLTKYLPKENSYVTLINHTKIEVGSVTTATVCTDIRSCRAYLAKKERKQTK